MNRGPDKSSCRSLKGRVRFCLDLQKSRKRKRKQPQGNATQQQDTESQSDNSQPLAGWLFRPDNQNNGSVLTPEYLLSVPSSLLMDTCDACRFQQHVCIDKYSILPFKESKGPTSGLLEVHSSGLSLLQRADDDDSKLTGNPIQDNDTSHEKDNCEGEIWTLQQLARREALDAELARQNLSVAVEDSYTIRGLITSVTPIITLDPSDPFVLMSITDPQDHNVSSTVVVRGEALELHPVLQPGTVLLFKQLARLAWRIPSVLEAKLDSSTQSDGCPDAASHTLLSLIPSRVFVLQDAARVRWCRDSTQASAPLLLAEPHLVTFKGRIESVTTHTSAKDSNRSIHFLDIIPEEVVSMPHGTKGNSQRLFITYLPMSSSLQLSLRPGAIVLVNNAHKMGKEDFAACLRSSLNIVQTASKFPRSHTTATTASSSFIVEPSSCIPFSFNKRLQRPYIAFAMTRYVLRFLRGWKMRVDDGVPSVEQWVNVLLDMWKHIPPCSFNPRDQKLIRNAYAEFFDHGEEGSCGKCSLGCHLSQFETVAKPSKVTPRFLQLEELQDAALITLKTRLGHYIQSQSLQPGWTGSIALESTDLQRGCSEKDKMSLDEVSDLYTGGRVASDSDCDEKRCPNTQSILVGNGVVELPFVLSPHSERPEDSGYIDSYVLGRVVTVTASCLFVGCAKSSGQKSTQKGCSHLQTFSSVTGPRVGPQPRGPCSFLLFSGSGQVFAVSVFLEVDKLACVPRSDESAPRQLQVPSNLSLASVGMCMLPSTSEAEVISLPSVVTAIVVRKQFNLFKVRNGKYRGFTVSFAHVSPCEGNKGLSAKDITTLQMMDCKPEISVGIYQQTTLRKFFATTLGWVDPSEEQLGTSLAWWKLACSKNLCMLLSGGWEEIADVPSCISRTKGILLRFPSSAVNRDPRRGYMRIRCELGDMSTHALSLETSTEDTMCSSTCTDPVGLDFIGAARLFPGTLDRRPPRRKHAELRHGELLGLPSGFGISGIPVCSIADLHALSCRELKERRRLYLAPSMVRQIRGASFVGVSYCRALAECSKCFAPLQFSSSRKNQQTTPSTSHDSKPNPEAEKHVNRSSFWHLPLPKDKSGVGGDSQVQPAILQSTNEHQPSEIQKIPPAPQNTKKRNGVSHSFLECPKKCNLERFGVIKWECSGTLDDGIGQAKLYAEREAALLLLGLPSPYAESIEQAAWLSPDGVIFSKTTPPNRAIRYAIQHAKSMAAADQTRERPGQELREADVLRYLSPAVRADYLLQRHCRLSPEPTRELIYYVRCKPLADGLSHLSHTEIDLVPAQNIPSYSLPPLKLNLVDCRTVPVRGRNSPPAEV